MALGQEDPAGEVVPQVTPSLNADPNVDLSIPDTFSDDVLEDLVGDVATPSDGSTTETGTATAPTAAEPDSNLVDGNRMARMENMVAAMAQKMVQNESNSQAPDAKSSQSEQDLMTEVLKELPISDEANSNFTSEDANFLVGTIAKVVDAKMSNQMSGISKKLDFLGGAVTQSQSQGVVEAFDKHVDKLMDDADIASPFERKTMRSQIIQDGVARYKNNFGNQQASELFRELNAERLSGEVQNRETYVTTKQREERETPAAQPGSTGASVSESIRKAINDPKNRDFDMRGQKMTELATALLNRQ